MKKITLFLITGLAINMALAQTVRKVGDNLSTLDKNAVLEVESTTKGFLPPRMNMTQLKAITNSAKGLIVWCNDCNLTTTPASGQLYIYLGSAWSPLTMNTTFNLTTNTITINAAKAVTVTGTFVSGDQPTETGVVYREITGNDFQTLPVLDSSGNANALNNIYKVATGTPVTTAGNDISVTIPTLSTSTSGTKAYYFRAYAWSPFGIGYGKALIYNLAPPTISTPIVSNGNTTNPTFAGTLTVNAGTPPNTITEYGYCSNTATNPTTSNNKIVLSTPTTLAGLNKMLDTKGFTADPTIDLAVNNYDLTSPLPLPRTLSTIYFKYYVTTANGQTTYSDEVNFTPKDPITGGSARATLNNIELSKQLTIGKNSTSNFKVHFNVTSPGDYAGFELKKTRGNTTGISIANVPAGSFATVGDNVLTFAITGTPFDSLDGNFFTISRIQTTLSTGDILPDPVTGGTAVVTVTPTIENSPLVPPLKIGEPGSGIFRVRFNVTHAGTYADFTPTMSGATQGLSMTNVPAGAGNFTTGDQLLTFTVSGTPDTSLDGNTLVVPRIGTLSTGPIALSPARFASATVAPMQGALKMGSSSSATFNVTFSVTKAGSYNFVPTTLSQQPQPSGGYTKGLSMDTKSGVYLNTGLQSLTFTVSGTPTFSSAGNTFNIPEFGNFNTGSITKRNLIATNITFIPFEVGNTRSVNLSDYVTIDGNRAGTSDVNFIQGISSNPNLRLSGVTGQVDAGFGNDNKLDVGSYTLVYTVTDDIDPINNSAGGTVTVTVTVKKIEAPKKADSARDVTLNLNDVTTVNVLKDIKIGGQPATFDNIILEERSSNSNVLGIITERTSTDYRFGDIYCGYKDITGSGPRKLQGPGTFVLVYRVIDKSRPSNFTDVTFKVEVNSR